MRVRFRRSFRRLQWAIVALVAVATVTYVQPGMALMRAQLPPIPGLSEALAPQPATGVQTEPVWLDGRVLFHVAQVQAPTNGEAEAEPEDVEAEPVPELKLRAQGIEQNLYQIIDAGFNPETLDVGYKIVNSLPVIVAKDGKRLKEREIMTVTHLDASLSPYVDVDEEDGEDADAQAKARAEELVPVIEEALQRGWEERQTDYLLVQSLISGAIVLAAAGLSAAVSVWRRRLGAKRQQLLDRANSEPSVSPEGEEVSPEENAIAMRQRVKWRQQVDLCDVQRRLLQIGQAIAWIGVAAAIVGLFPYTRWLQPLIFSKPLSLLGVVLGTYMVVRLSGIMVDRFFSVIEPSEFLDTRASQRLLLRFSTLVPVAKSVVAFTVMVVGAIVGLIVLGIDASPLLAGAGIVGLALSFASQNLLRDAINGFLILMEDQYAVGDVVEIGDVSGFVEYMSLRVTELRNPEGRLITVPHGTISVVQNLSKDWSRVDLTIKVAYETDPDLALETIDRVCAEMFADPDWNDKILEPATVLGIDELSHEGILIRTWIKTAPLKQWEVARECRRRLKLSLDRAGISIGLPKETVMFSRSRPQFVDGKN